MPGYTLSYSCFSYLQAYLPTTGGLTLYLIEPTDFPDPQSKQSKFTVRGGALQGPRLLELSNPPPHSAHLDFCPWPSRPFSSSARTLTKGAFFGNKLSVSLHECIARSSPSAPLPDFPAQPSPATGSSPVSACHPHLPWVSAACISNVTRKVPRCELGDLVCRGRIFQVLSSSF